VPVRPAILKAFSRVRVLAVGDLVADHYLFGQTERVSREAPVLVVRHEADVVRLGGGANAAANARSLGARVTALGVLGDDAMGRELRRLFAAQGITVRAVGGKDVCTETKTRVLAGGVGTTLQQMLRIDRGVTAGQPKRVRRALARALDRLVPRSDVVVVSDYGAGTLCTETLVRLKEWSLQGRLVCVDSRFALGAFAGVSVCKPNEPELAAFTGLPVTSDDEVLAAGAVAREQLGCRVLLVTRGRRGMAVFEAGRRPELIPVWGPEEAVDVTGAGDTVLASFALALAAGLSAVDAARLANVAGGLVVQKQGTATVTQAELVRGLRA
jgi:rfaE bifunctional protein kinase chain/domain